MQAKSGNSLFLSLGVPGLIKADMVKDGAVVIDFGKCQQEHVS